MVDEYSVVGYFECGRNPRSGSVLEVTFDAFTTNGANNLITGNLRSQKCFTERQVIIGKFR